jgi:hypothetical protein
MQMRKLLQIASALWLFLLVQPSFAAIAATAQWDVRTTGNDANGGAFDPSVTIPGTDYSQQNSAQVAFTDLVIGGTTTQVTSAANPFATCTAGVGYCGNFIHITGGSGCTVGWYEVLSTSTITATLDRSAGTAASTCTGNLGGSIATPVAAMNVMASSNTVWVQSGTYTQTVNGLVNNAANPAVAYITGYNATHGDGGTAPLLTTATNSIDIIRLATGNFWTFTNVSFSSTAGTRGNGIQQFTGGGGLTVSCTQCTFDGFTNAFNGDNAGSHGVFNNIYLDRAELKNGGDGVVNTGGGTLVFLNCYVHNNGRGSNASFGAQFVIGSIFANNTTDAFTMSGGSNLQAINSVFTGSTSGGSGAGIRFDVGAQNAIVNLQNNILYGDTVGFLVNTGNPVVIANNNNAYGSNTTNRSGISAGANDVTLTANPFTNAGAGDYSLNSTAGGGALLKGTGFPGIFPGATSTGHLDIGAVQSSGGGGGAVGNFGVSN